MNSPKDLLNVLLAPPLNQKELFALLRREDCDPNSTNTALMTPLKAAIMNCNAEVVAALIDRGAQVDSAVINFATQKYGHKEGVIAVILRAIADKAMKEAVPDPGLKPVVRSSRHSI